MKNKTLIFFLVLFAGVIVVGGTLEGCTEESSANTVTEHQWVDVPPGYIGSTECAKCHQQEYDMWMGSHHQLAMLPASDASIRGDFNDASFKSEKHTMRFFKQGDEFLVNAKGKDGQFADHKVLFTFGYEPLQQYLVEAKDGQLQALTVAWNTEKGEWMDIIPEIDGHDEWLHWTGNSMTWNAMCADCHSTAFRKNYKPKEGKYESTWAEVNVACEACHGPGKEHIAAVESGSNSSAGLFMTSGSSSAELVDACAPCHSRRSAITRHFDPREKYLDQYDPATITPRLYHADGQIMDEVYVYGSFRQSKMYHWGVKCTDCHDPHTAQLKLDGNDMCASCHTPEKYNVFGHHFHEEGSEGAQCKNCHMPGKFYMQNDFRYDHSFRVPRPDLGVEYGTPDACTNCHNDKSQEWAATAIEERFGSERPYHWSEIMLAARSGKDEDIRKLAKMASDTATPSFVRASAIDLLSTFNNGTAFNAIVKGLEDEEPLVRIASINAFNYLPQNDRVNTITPHLRDEYRAVRLAAARNMADINGKFLRPDYAASLSEALVELRNALEANLDMRDGLFAYGMYLEKIGMPEKALEAYIKCLETDGLYNSARMNASAVLNRLGRNKEAKEVLEEFIRTEPESAQAHYALGLLQAELNNMPACIASLETAVTLDSTVSRYWYNLGLALDRTGEKAKAEKAYYNSLGIDPNHVPALKALTIIYWELGMKSDALVMAQRMEELVPEDPEVQRLAAQLRKDLGISP